MKRKLWSIVLSAMLAVVTLLAFAGCGTTTYSITFKDYDGTELTTLTVNEKEAVIYDGAAPSREASAEFTYTFVGWADAEGTVLATLPDATADATYTATYNSRRNSYTVTFVNGETELYEETLEYGAEVTYGGATPTKDATAQYTYTFAGWSTTADGEVGEIGTVTGETTYYAAFTATVNEYDVTWMVEGGGKTTQVAYGETALYGSIPEKAATAQYTYTFAGWALEENGDVLDTSAMVVEGEVTYYAVFTSDVNKYLVKFVDEEGTVLDSQTLDYGSAVEYKGAAPEKAATAQYTYTHAGWTDGEGVDYSLAETLPAVAGEATYTVKFSSTVNKYEITWNVNGTETKVEVEYGATPAFAGTPAIEPTVEYQWNFKGWSTEENGAIADVATVTGAETYYAIFERATREYAIVWNVDGVLTNTSFVAGVVPSNELSPARAATAKYTYTFAGWAKEAEGEVIDLATDLVDGDQTYYAIFNATVNKYTVTFYNEDGETVLQAVEIEYDAKASYPSDVAAPSKEGSAKYSYTYAGWTDGENDYAANELPVVTGDASYTVIFTESINKYTITVNYVVAGEGEKPANPSTQSVTLDYGTIYNEDNSPVSPKVEGYLPDHFYFGGMVTEDKTYTVTYGKASVWDGTFPATEGYALEGAGTAESPYLIQSAQDLAYLSAAAKGIDGYGKGLYYKVTTNIDLAGHAWQPIGYELTVKVEKYFKFSGSFDGAGHTIAGLSVNDSTKTLAGLFNSIDNEVKNLTVEGSFNVLKWVGGIACVAYAPAKITNCTSYVDITCAATDNVYAGGVAMAMKGVTVENFANYGDITAGGARIGGLIGAVNTSGENAVSNCVNYGDIGGVTYNIGGLLGICDRALTVTNCVNYGKVSATASNAASVGGIVAQLYGNFNFSVSNCTNYSEVSTIGAQVGGVVGYSWIGDTNVSTISDCYNYGKVAGAQKMGGVLGYAKNTLVTKCYNHATVDSSACVGASTGGIFGWMSGAGAKIVDVINYGDVIGSTEYAVEGKTQTSGATSHGGIAGYGSGSIKTAVNYGNVYGSLHLGGIIGDVSGATTDDVINYGNVTSGEIQSKEVGIAGIVGWHTNGSKTTNAKNYGDVNGYSNVGGIVGYSGAGSVVDKDYNYGDVYGHDAVGGIGGHANSSITNSHNEGRVESQTKNAGGISGYNANIVSDCTNKGDVYGKTDVGGIVGNADGQKAENSIVNCTNSGNVYGIERVGGIAGNTFKTAVTNCTNNGNVGVNGEMSDDVYATAGIVGHATNNTVITGCTNNGNVTGDNVVGGIAGYLGAAGETLACSQVVNCVNNGEVNGQAAETTGDIVGWNKGEIINEPVEETPEAPIE